MGGGAAPTCVPDLLSAFLAERGAPQCCGGRAGPRTHQHVHQHLPPQHLPDPTVAASKRFKSVACNNGCELQLSPRMQRLCTVHNANYYAGCLAVETG